MTVGRRLRIVPPQGRPAPNSHDPANRALDALLGAAIACTQIRERDLAATLLDGCDQLIRHQQVDRTMIENVVRVRRDLGIARARVTQSSFTRAELRLLPALATCMSFAEIGDSFSLSRHTIKTQAISIYRKLDASSRSQAVARATQLGLVG